MNNNFLNKWGTCSNHIKLVFVIGCIIIFISLFYYGFHLYSESLSKNVWGYNKLLSIYEEYGIAFVILYFVDIIAKCIFYISIIPLLFFTKRWIIISIFVLFDLMYNVFDFFSPETFAFSFSIEGFKLYSFIVSVIISLAFIVVSTLYFTTAKTKMTKIGSLLWLIEQIISFVILIGYAVMFSVDSTYYTETYISIIDIIKFYNSYVGSLLFLMGTILITYEVHNIEIPEDDEL